ncbi:hypothetical protein Tco_0413967, partial [Tanacetum coccineum]
MSLQSKHTPSIANIALEVSSLFLSFSIEDIDADVDVSLSTKPDDSIAGEAGTTGSVDDSDVPSTIKEVTLAQTLIQIKAAKPKVELSEFRVSQETQPSSSKDKGKGIMIETEVTLKRKDQIALDEQIARDAQAKEIVALKKRIQRLEMRKISRPTGLKRLKKV